MRLSRLWYTPGEAYKVMGLKTRKHVEQLMREGKLPYCQISPRRRVILSQDIVDYIVGRRVGAEVEASPGFADRVIDEIQRRNAK